MNEATAVGTIAVIVLTSISSLIGFRDPRFRDRFLFSVREILAEKQYYRLVTSAFLHADFPHLLMNMVTLYLFGRYIELFFGVGKFLLIYFAAVVGGDLLALWIHRQHEYQAYGASGGVCGMVYSFILLFPGGGIMIFFIPLAIPGWLYAILYLLGSFVALKAQRDNIGHDAHLGGAVVGLWTTAALQPMAVRSHPALFAVVSGVSVLLFIYLAVNPMFLPFSGFLPSWRRSSRSTPDKPPSHGRDSQEVDSILEKVSKEGIDSLTAGERAVLERTSAKCRWREGSSKRKSGLSI
jgi:membrane associated rhomboid family serine protease